MNHIYRSIWNESTGTVTAVSEHAKRGGKKTSNGKTAVVRAGFILNSVSAAVALACGSAVHASPTGGTVVAGNASIHSAAGNTTIQQTSQNAVLNWQSFDIGAAEAVSFVQPSSNAVALNRVLGADPSSILGSLSSNGKVFLVNPNGILFGTGAQVNVGGLVASTRDLADKDFLAGRYTFSGDSNGGIVNQGSIHADGGYVALLGANVSNQGVIAAKLGSVALASGNSLTLDVAGDGLLNVTVNAGAVDALVHNGGLIQADGGQVLLTARSASNLLQSAVNNTGVIQAQTIENRNGTIRLLGDMDNGSVHVAGTLDASAPTGGNGGFIDTSAAFVKVASDTRVTTAAARGLTGSWLIDPTDYTIAASGGDITGAALSSNLASSNVTLQSSAGTTGTAGNVNVNDTVAWSANQLTLNAQNNININIAMNASGTASLALEYGQGAVAAGNTSKVNVNAPVNLTASSNFSTQLGSNGTVINYTVITALGAAGSTTGTDLQGMSGNLAGKYVLGANIDAASTNTWNAGAGFAPIGSNATRFTGIFDGLGHTVSGLYLNVTGSNPVGFFGYTAAGSTIRNLGLIGGSVASDSWGTGALVGALGGTVMNSYATGNVSGFQTVGGLVGVIDGGAIIDSHATGDVVGYGNGEAGGLVGLSWGGPPGTVTNSYATGNVSSPVGNVGGLMGINWGTVTDSYATGTASGTDDVGGLIGNNSLGSVANSYATGAVNGRYSVGGLAGNNSNTISNSHATGAVAGSAYVGGLVGGNSGGNLIGNYSTGTVTAGDYVGGLAGIGWYGAINGNHASGAVNGTGDNIGGLIGYSYGGGVSDNYASGAVTGRNSVGGFAGANYGYGSLNNNYASGAVSGANFVGGLIGSNREDVRDSYATGSVTGDDQVAGLVGGHQYGTISNSYATGNVIARTGASGGLVGYSSSPIANSYATGAVSGVYQVGGLLGAMNGSSISNSYATGTVTGTGNIGGLVGNSSYGTISNAYSTGAVSGTTDVGGLLGSSVGAAVSNGFWNTTTSGQSASAAGSGLTTVQMMQLASFSSWNTSTPNTIADTGSSGAIWRIYAGHTAPLLTHFLTALTLTDVTVTYTGAAHNGASGAPSGVLGTTATNAGFYSFYSNQQGYDLTGGTLTIDKANLSLSGTRIYDGSTAVAGSALTAVGVAGEAFVVAGSGDASNLASKNIQTSSTLASVTGLSLGAGVHGGIASNYNALSTAGSSVSITRAALIVVNQVAVDKEYDGTTAATLRGGSLVGVVAGETLAFNQAGTFATADAGNAITVTATNSVSGAAASNYTLTQPVGLAANITAAVQPEIPPVIVAPVIDPPVVVVTPPPVTSTVTYTSAVGHVVSNIRIAPPTQIGSPRPVALDLRDSGSMGLMTLDLAGLNLTVISADGGVRAVPSDDKK